MEAGLPPRGNPQVADDGLVRVVRRAARAILIDGNGRLVVFRRTLPKRKPYWSTPGGGVDREDGSVEAALHRELAEELGATVDRVQQVFLTSPPRGDGIAVSHFFVCRLVSMDLSKRTGEEFTNPAKGRYDVERIDLRGKKLSRYALQPPEAKAFILANRQALLNAALTDDAPPLTLADDPAAAIPVPPARAAAAPGSAVTPAADESSAADGSSAADETSAAGPPSAAGRPAAPDDAGAAEPAPSSDRSSASLGTSGEPPESAEDTHPDQVTPTDKATPTDPTTTPDQTSTPDEVLTADQTLAADPSTRADETVITDPVRKRMQAESEQVTAREPDEAAGDAPVSRRTGSGDAGTPNDGSPAPTPGPSPATADAAAAAQRRPRRAMPPILEIVDGAVVNDGSDPPTRALPRRHRWPRWPFGR